MAVLVIDGCINVDWGGSIGSVDLVGDVARAENVRKLCFGGDGNEADTPCSWPHLLSCSNSEIAVEDKADEDIRGGISEYIFALSPENEAEGIGSRGGGEFVIDWLVCRSGCKPFSLFSLLFADAEHCKSSPLIGFVVLTGSSGQDSGTTVLTFLVENELSLCTDMVLLFFTLPYF